MSNEDDLKESSRCIVEAQGHNYAVETVENHGKVS